MLYIYKFRLFLLRYIFLMYFSYFVQLSYVISISWNLLISFFINYNNINWSYKSNVINCYRLILISVLRRLILKSGMFYF